LGGEIGLLGTQLISDFAPLRRKPTPSAAVKSDRWPTGAVASPRTGTNLEAILIPPRRDEGASGPQIAEAINFPLREKGLPLAVVGGNGRCHA
jgi:hypothetical protein